MTDFRRSPALAGCRRIASLSRADFAAACHSENRHAEQCSIRPSDTSRVARRCSVAVAALRRRRRRAGARPGGRERRHRRAAAGHRGPDAADRRARDQGSNAKPEDDAKLVEIRLQLEELPRQLLTSGLAFRPRLTEINARIEQLGPPPAEGSRPNRTSSPANGRRWSPKRPRSTPCSASPRACRSASTG